MSFLLAGVLVYVLAQLAIGVVISRRIRTEEDYFVAGRRLGPVLATGSIFATWFGAETCVGAAGQVYERGLDRTSVEPFAYGITLILMGLLFAAPFWRSRIVTLADLFRKRYSPAVERAAAILLIPTSVLWAAAQVRAFGHVLASTGSFEIDVALGISAVVVIAYTAAGGLMADVVTDLVQAIALGVGLLAVLVVVVLELGGVGPALDAAAESVSRNAATPDFLGTLEAWSIPICGSIVAQEVISRAVASRSAEVARRSTILGGGLYLAVGLVPVFLGLVGSRLAPDLADPEQLLPVLAGAHLPTILHVLFAGALISAILSTVDSTLLVASSLLSRNLLLAGRDEVSQKTRLRVARLGVIGFGLAAWALALGAEGVFALVEDASGFGSAGILVIVVFGLFTRFGGPASALASLAAGAGVWIAGRYGGIGLAHPYLASLAAALAAFVGVGVALRRKAAASV
jgi:SSS family transporter